MIQFDNVFLTVITAFQITSQITQLGNAYMNAPLLMWLIALLQFLNVQVYAQIIIMLILQVEQVFVLPLVHLIQFYLEMQMEG